MFQLAKLKIGPMSNLLSCMYFAFVVGIYSVMIALAVSARLLNLGVLVNSFTRSTTELSYQLSGSGRSASHLREPTRTAEESLFSVVVIPEKVSLLIGVSKSQPV